MGTVPKWHSKFQSVAIYVFNQRSQGHLLFRELVRGGLLVEFYACVCCEVTCADQFDMIWHCRFEMEHIQLRNFSTLAWHASLGLFWLCITKPKSCQCRLWAGCLLSYHTHTEALKPRWPLAPSRWMANLRFNRGQNDDEPKKASASARREIWHTWQYMARRVSRAREFVFALPWADKKQLGNHLSKCTCVGTTLFSDLKIFRWAVPGWQQCKDAAFAPSGLCCFKLPGCMLWSLQHLNIDLPRSAVHLFLLWSRLRLYILFRLMEPVLHISRMWPKQVVHQGQLTFVAPKALAFGIASFCKMIEEVAVKPYFKSHGLS